MNDYNQILDALKWDDQGLIPAIAQDAESGKILMFAWMNRDSLLQSIQSRKAVYWSRSRQKLWAKGEESGNTQEILSIRCDCDKDVILLGIRQNGGIACHTGRERCFFNLLDGHQWQVTDPVITDPGQMYKK